MRLTHLKWPIAAGIIVVLLVVFWPANDSQQEQPQSSVDASKPSGKEDSSAAAVAAEPHSETPAPLSMRQEPPAPEVIAPSETEVCGVGTVKLDLTDDAAVARYEYSLISEAFPRWASALRRSKDIHAKAMGLALQTQIDVRNAVEEMERRLGPCSDADDACHRQIRVARSEILDRGAPELTEELVRLANLTRDPAIYALGAHVCRLSSDPVGGPCNAISIGQWIDVDPDNAIPWLAKAEAESLALNPAVRNDARNHASRAQRVERYDNLFFGKAFAHLPTSISPLQRAMLTSQLLKFEGSRRIGVEWLSCASPWTSENAQRRDACNSIAELFSAKATTLQDKDLGVILGRGLGWSKDRLQTLETEGHALYQTLFEALNPDLSSERLNPFSCDAVQKRNAHSENVAAVGELAAVRGALDKSGISAEVMANRCIARHVEDEQRAKAKAAMN